MQTSKYELPFPSIVWGKINSVQDFNKEFINALMYVSQHSVYGEQKCRTVGKFSSVLNNTVQKTRKGKLMPAAIQEQS